MKFAPRYTEENVNVPEHNQLRVFFRLSLYLLAVVCGLYFVLGFAADWIAGQLPPRFETVIAQATKPLAGGKDFPNTRQYLQKVLDRLVASASGLPEFSYRISIADQADVNAVALPAGNIVVFKGLLAEINSENELAMILGHELGHYAHRDHLRGMGRGLVFLSIMATLGLANDVPGFIAPSLQTFNLKYSRDQESAADYFALDLLAHTYGHVQGAFKVFAALERQEKNRGTDIFSTHPDTAMRKQALADRIKLREYHHQGAITSIPESGKLPFSGDSKEQK